MKTNKQLKVELNRNTKLLLKLIKKISKILDIKIENDNRTKIK
jgi:hypothetical protein